MSRNFFGNSGKKSGKKPGSMGNMSKLTRTKVQSREELLQDKASSMKSYDDMLEDLLDEKMMAGPGKAGFSQPGTKAKEEREMTKGMKAAMEMMAMQKLKKKNKKKKGKVAIKAQSFGMGPDGGRITDDGTIQGADGKILFRVDKDTGQIRDTFGKIVGKYKAGSVVNDTKIERLIQNAQKSAGVFNPFGGKQD